MIPGCSVLVPVPRGKSGDKQSQLLILGVVTRRLKESNTCHGQNKKGEHST